MIPTISPRTDVRPLRCPDIQGLNVARDRAGTRDDDEKKNGGKGDIGTMPGPFRTSFTSQRTSTYCLHVYVHVNIYIKQMGTAVVAR